MRATRTNLHEKYDCPIKEVLERCAASMNIEDAKQLRKASTHWFRHTHGSHALNGRPGGKGVPIQVVQNNLGHASIGTTSGYLTTDVTPGWRP